MEELIEGVIVLLRSFYGRREVGYVYGKFMKVDSEFGKLFVFRVPSKVTFNDNFKYTFPQF